VKSRRGGERGGRVEGERIETFRQSPISFVKVTVMQGVRVGSNVVPSRKSGGGEKVSAGAGAAWKKGRGREAKKTRNKTMMVDGGGGGGRAPPLYYPNAAGIKSTHIRPLDLSAGRGERGMGVWEGATNKEKKVCRLVGGGFVSKKSLPPRWWGVGFKKTK